MSEVRNFYTLQNNLHGWQKLHQFLFLVFLSEHAVQYFDSKLFMFSVSLLELELDVWVLVGRKCVGHLGNVGAHLMTLLIRIVKSFIFKSFEFLQETSHQ